MSHGAKWDSRFLELAAVISGWSKHPEVKVGAVVVDQHRRVIGTGYNGPAPMIDDCAIEYKRNVSRTLHAEINALLFAAPGLRGATLYCTRHPCAQCAAAIIAAGVQSVVIPAGNWYADERWADHHVDASDQFAESGVRLVVRK